MSISEPFALPLLVTLRGRSCSLNEPCHLFDPFSHVSLALACCTNLWLKERERERERNEVLDIVLLIAAKTKSSILKEIALVPSQRKTLHRQNDNTNQKYQNALGNFHGKDIFISVSVL
jgi:hypothetical protein